MAAGRSAPAKGESSALRCVLWKKRWRQSLNRWADRSQMGLPSRENIMKRRALYLAVAATLSTPITAPADIEIFQDGQYSIEVIHPDGFPPSAHAMHVSVADPQGGGAGLGTDYGFITIMFGNVLLPHGMEQFDDHTLPVYHSHSGLAFRFTLNFPPLTSCTTENTEGFNPLSVIVKDCPQGLVGKFSLENLPTLQGANNGWYEWDVTGGFDANGVGTFTLTPQSSPSDSSVAIPRPDIEPFQATFAQLLMMLY
jgi:hypothetical protein